MGWATREFKLAYSYKDAAATTTMRRDHQRVSTCFFGDALVAVAAIFGAQKGGPVEPSPKNWDSRRHLRRSELAAPARPEHWIRIVVCRWSLRTDSCDLGEERSPQSEPFGLCLLQMRRRVSFRHTSVWEGS